MDLSDWSSLPESLQRELVIKWYKEDSALYEYHSMAEKAAKVLKEELKLNADVKNVMVGAGEELGIGRPLPIRENILHVCTLLPGRRMIENLPARFLGFRVEQLNLKEKRDAFLETLTFVTDKLRGWTRSETIMRVDEHYRNEPLNDSLSGGFLFDIVYDKGPLDRALCVIALELKKELPNVDVVNLRNRMTSVISEAITEAGSREYNHPNRAQNLDWDSVRIKINDIIKRERRSEKSRCSVGIRNEVLMGAFNWIIVDVPCPACHKQVEIRCQTHVASDYGGDERGRFQCREYRLGESMAWWPKEHREYSAWRANGRIGQLDKGEIDSEACYASCPACDADLYVVLEFDGPCPVKVKDIGLEGNWPEGYWA